MASAKLVDRYSESAIALARAHSLLQCYKKRYPARQVVLVFDIDDTLLTERNDDEYQCLEHVRSLLTESRKRLGAKVYIITAREDDPAGEVKAWTARQLDKIGISRRRDYDELFLIPGKMRLNKGLVSQAKFDIRRRICQELAREKITLSIGDQWTDIVRFDKEKDIPRFDSMVSATPSGQHVDVTNRKRRTAEDNDHKIIRVNNEYVIWGLKLPHSY